MGIPVIRTRFWPRPMILPSLTTTAPNGPPHPFSTDSMASRVASWANCFLYSSLSISVVLMCLFSFYCSWVCVGLLWMEKSRCERFCLFLEERERTNAVLRSYYMDFQKIATDNA